MIANDKIRVFNIHKPFWTLYFAFIIAMPYDVFSSTALIKLEQPASVLYYRVSVFYFSILFLPFVLYGILHSFRKNQYVLIHPLALILALALKDVFLYLIESFSPQAFWFSTYGNYIIASLYFICVATVYQDSIDDFLKLYAVVNILTLLVSVITGIGQGILNGRSHMSAMHQGETAAILSILAVYFGFKEKDKINWIPIMLGIILVFFTGNRKDIAFILLSVVIFLLRKKRFDSEHKISKKSFLLFGALIIIVFMIILGSGEKILNLFAFDRYTDLLTGIINQGLASYITGDDSFIGRIASLQAGLEVVKDNPVFGGMFSLIDCQRNVQAYGYPTFPHSTVLYLYCVMGIIAIYPIYMYIKTGVKLIKINHPLQYTFLYIFIRDTISGGANEAIKYLLLMMIILNYGKLAVYRFENDNVNY